MNAESTVLSPQQLDACRYLCLNGGTAAPILCEQTTAKPHTLVSLIRLGLVNVRAAGGRDPLYHLTKFGRDLTCAQTNDDDESSDLQPTGWAPTPKEEHMSTTEKIPQAKPDPKPAAKRSRKKDASATPPATTVVQPETAEQVPPVEDVTGNAPAAAKQDMTPLFEELLGAAKKAIKGDVEVVEKVGYVRLKAAGKTVVYLDRPTSKGVKVSVPKAEGSGYDVVKATSSTDVPKALELVEARASA